MRYVLDTNILLHYMRESALSVQIDELLITDINSEDLIERYAEIDAFSHGKLTDRPLGMSARNMGKNDLWIAATASVLNASLLTTDFDFNHLHDEFLDLQLVTI